MSVVDPDLCDLLVEWEDRRDDGTPVPPEVLCRHRPDLLAEFTALVRQLARLDPVLTLHTAAERPVLPRIPGFDILEVVGQGGMGTVYRAVDVVLGQVVAVKKPRGATAVSRARFAREVQALAKLRDHPHIVPIYSAGMVDGEPYLVMDYIPGGSLADRKATFAANLDRAVAFFAKVARAVDHAHRAGILHRDLKPSNILIAADGQPRVSDFGVAALLAGEPVVEGDATETTPGRPFATRVTRTGATAGTPAYAAPEASDGSARPLTSAADVWSLGVILEEVLAGAKNGTPPGLAAIVRKCLAKDPADRHRTAGALADALEGWVRHRRFSRWSLRLGVALVAVLQLCGVVATRQDAPDAEERHAAAVADAADALRRGKAATLAGRSGNPATARLRLGDGYTRMGLGEDGTFTVAAPRPCLVEFLTDPGIGSYRLTAEIRQDGYLGDAAVGLYVGHHPVRGPAVAGEVFALFRFSDFGRLAGQLAVPNGDRRSLAAVDHLCLVPPVAVGRDWTVHNGPQLAYPPPARRQLPGPWRTLVLEATPKSILARFDNEPLRPYMLRFAAAWADALPAFRPNFTDAAVRISSRGGLGFYVCGGQASIRNCRIEPLP